jgi:hypothetical protein
MFKKLFKFFFGVGGDKFEPGVEYEFDLYEETAALVRKLDDRLMSDDELLALAKAHAHNVSDRCDLCEDLEENAEDDLYYRIFNSAQNPTAELIEVLSKHYEWEHAGHRVPSSEGAYESQMVRFLTHPNSSLENLLESGDHFGYAFRCDQVHDDIEGADDEGTHEEGTVQYLLDALAPVMSHPLVNQTVLDNWRDAIHYYELSGVFCDGEAASCSWCNGVIQKAKIS